METSQEDEKGQKVLAQTLVIALLDLQVLKKDSTITTAANYYNLIPNMGLQQRGPCNQCKDRQ